MFGLSPSIDLQLYEIFFANQHFFAFGLEPVRKL